MVEWRVEKSLVMTSCWAILCPLPHAPHSLCLSLAPKLLTEVAGAAAVAVFDQLLRSTAGAGGKLPAVVGSAEKCEKFWVKQSWRQRVGIRSCGTGVVGGDRRRHMDLGSEMKALADGPGYESSKSSTSADIDRWNAAISRARFGKPIIIEPRAQHLATIVWLHGLGDNGYGWASTLEMLPLPNVKWIVPTAPVRPVTVNGGFPCTAWFDVGSLSDDGPDDLQGLDLSAAFVASFLAREPPGIRLGVGGFSQGAATSLYSMTRSVAGKYSDGTPFPLKIEFAVGLSGWLPSSKFLKSQEGNSTEFARLAAEVPLYLAHGKRDFVVAFQFGEKSAQFLQELGFNKIVFRPYTTLEHTSTQEELDEMCHWITLQL